MTAIFTPAMYPEGASTECSFSVELATWEAGLVQHVPRERLTAPLYGVLARRDPQRPDQWVEMAFHVNQAAFAIDYWLSAFGDHDLFLSQHSFRGPERRDRLLSTLNMTVLDLDVEKSLGAGADMEKVFQEVLAELEKLGIPAPSYVVASGYGLHLKWLYSAPIPAKARSRWAAVNRHLCTALAAWGADTNAVATTQVMRIVGSANHKGIARQVRLAWVNRNGVDPSRVDFDELAAAVLPVSREECRDANREKAAHARRCAALAQRFAANRAEVRRLDQTEGRNRRGSAASSLQTSARGGRTGVGLPAVADRLVAADRIHSQRLKKLEAAIEQTCGGQVPHGRRNAVAWLAAWCIAWIASARGEVNPLPQLERWCERWIPTFTAREVRACGSSVLSRAAHPAATVDPERGLYRISEPRFRKAIADALALEETHPILTARSANDGGELRLEVKRRGAMLEAYSMAPIRGLSPVAFREERRRRQQMGGVYAAAQRTKTRPADIAQAREMAAAGMSGVQIAKAKGVSPATVCRWLKTPPAETFTLHVRLAAPVGLAQVMVRAVRGISNGVSNGGPQQFAAAVAARNGSSSGPTLRQTDVPVPIAVSSSPTPTPLRSSGALAAATLERCRPVPSFAAIEERVRAGVRTACDWAPWARGLDFRGAVQRESCWTVLGFAAKGSNGPASLSDRDLEHASESQAGLVGA
jgi:hypothetical protein